MKAPEIKILKRATTVLRSVQGIQRPDVMDTSGMSKAGAVAGRCSSIVQTVAICIAALIDDGCETAEMWISDAEGELEKLRGDVKP